MSPKFCSNISFMFTEVPYLERFAAAKNSGFKAVESGFPFGFQLEDVVKAKNAANIQLVLINTFTGDVSKREFGFAAIPGQQNQFRESIALTLKYAKLLGAKKIHIMSGLVENPTEQNRKCYEENLRYAATLLEPENILGLIEPINSYTVPGYYMNSYKNALEVVKSINSPFLKIMFDIFHLQHIQGNVYNTIHEYQQYIGHVQIAQCPHRHEPDTNGELNYPFIFDTLQEKGYTDWMGLEYKPANGSAQGLKWLEKFGYNL